MESDVEEKMATVSDLVRDRVDRRISWAVTATFVASEHGDPVCIEYRARQVRGQRDFQDFGEATNRLTNGHQTLEAMVEGAQEGWVGSGPFSPKGIPRYVFEVASQGRLLDKARSLIQRRAGRPAPEGRRRIPADPTPEVARVLSVPAHRPGRPPQRSVGEKLRILAAVEAASAEGGTLADVAADFHMSRSALRDLLSWARKDAQPRLFTARGPGRGGGELTPEARAMLNELEGEE